MTHIKQSLSWWCFPTLKPEELVSRAADIGYRGFELVGQEYWPLIKSHGLEIVSISGHASINDGLNRKENRLRITNELSATLDLAVKWGIPNLICFSGNRYELDDESCIEITAENLAYLSEMAEKAGVTLVLELLNSKVDHLGYQCDHSDWGVKVIRLVGSRRVKLLYDIYHMQIMEGDIIRTIRENYSWIGHYHTAGVPGRHEIDETQELYYPAILRTILETGYDGYIGQEFVPTGNPIKAIRDAYQRCNLLLEKS